MTETEMVEIEAVLARREENYCGWWVDGEMRALIAEVRNLRALLARLEWAGGNIEGDSCCPECAARGERSFAPFEPHTDGCRLAEAIR
jgi:hypothetical protein